ncbi:HAD family hydrolase ['Paenibacillus yunnanensis' Narsing Rao et al. 2020]|uniref:HAD family hydrolase n=1 Tax=Paenibacillus tengchongensis TaxID=2608684 RepID=UPI00124BDD65|nr:HAD family hydrolase [Paenibacillus tengchongensis]
MSLVKVISLDMFQTLVNIQGRNPQVWQPILQSSYSEALAKDYGAKVLACFLEEVEALRLRESFRISRDIFEQSYNQVFTRYSIAYDPAKAVEHLFAEHRRADLYPDTEAFLQRTCAEYEVCIVSDTDLLMLPEFYRNYPLTLFTSEQYQSYKNDSRNLMFHAVIDHYGVRPEEILHIGDSAGDVLGAARAGIRSCWINRTGAEWMHGVKPDLTVTTLDDVYGWLAAGRQAG